MKKNLFYFCLLVSIKLTFGNPVVTPQAIISEFKFETFNEWVLEIGFVYGVAFNHADFDSICLATSNGFSRIRLDYVKDSIYIFVITSDSLEIPLNINSDGDCIKLFSYNSMDFISEPLIDSLSFGNYPNSMFESIPSGYSICRLNRFLFTKDKSPTLGLENDTSGTCGILKGFIYDKNHNLVVNEDFVLDNQFKVDENGMYSTSVFARKFMSNVIYKFIPPGQYKTLLIDSIYININPDSVLERDIHCIDYVVGIEDEYPKQNYELEIINYPNPFNSTTNFLVKIPSELKPKVGEIIIYNSNGEKIFSISLSNSSLIRWNGQDSNGKPASSGIYYYQLLLDKVVYKNGSMILLK